MDAKLEITLWDWARRKDGLRLVAEVIDGVGVSRLCWLDDQGIVQREAHIETAALRQALDAVHEIQR